MAIVVSLQNVIDEMAGLSSEMTGYLNRCTGKLLTLANEDISVVEEAEDIDELTTMTPEIRAEVQEVINSTDWLELPNQFEINGYEIMVEFCANIDNIQLSQELQRAIHGNGAFQRFKEIMYREGIQDDWHHYRENALRDIAIRWLVAHHVAYQ